ncbi:hypothetical protein JM658_16585 [Joostella atrarenae]|uniref:HTH araC/xylS-type domain-containing protein n=1 Tax=Joostella atrarenae TaxID=679257 RepID=A0ABS9J7N7_9FLAO|nr:hypothetical protein [Joostella atrarenae]MCF8716446.1 hypothetical protein [Joostella atrarenae]
MKIIEHSYTLNNEWILKLAADLDLQFKDNFVIFNESYAKGAIYFNQVTENISVVLFDLKYKLSIQVNRKSTLEKLYIIHYDMSEDYNIFVSKSKTYKIGYEKKLGFTCMDGEISNIFKPKNKRVMFGLRILIKKATLNDSLPHEENNIPFFHDNMDGESKILMKYLKGINKMDRNFDSELKSISLELMGNFIEKYSITEDKFIKSQKYSKLAKNIRYFLLKNIHNSYPGNKMISKKFGISTLQLIKTFKTNYSVSPFDFFINEKLLLINKMLRSGHYNSVASIGDELNIGNMSHYTTKYYKLFGCEPIQDLKKSN